MNKSWRPKNWITILVGAGVLLTVGATAASLSGMNGRPMLSGLSAAPMRPVNNPAPAGAGMTELRMLNETFADLASSVADSVVEIRSERGAMSGGSGSGFIYRPDGWIVTNDHVVQGSETVTVVMHDGREYEGKVYSASDPQIDLAVVKIEATGLNPLPIADSSQVRPGQYAIAVGSPFGLESSVTIGHVSAVNRPGTVPDPRIGDFRQYSGMIQTDASINPGNSGGPLIDIDGQVIGVNSTINTLTGGSAGIGFAIPANTVKVVADELVANRKFDRGMLGIQFAPDDIKPYRLKELGIAGGALVSSAPENGPAYKAGIRVNDIILKVDNDQIKGQTDLLLSMYRRSPGDSVNVQYLRGGQTRTASIALGGSELRQQMEEQGAPRPRMRQRQEGDVPEMFRRLRPDFFPEEGGEQDRGQQPPARQGERPRLGVTVEDVSSSLRRQFRIPEDVKGVAVTGVSPESLADQYGMEVGDVIRSFNGKEITTSQALTEEMGKVRPGSTVELRFTRFGQNTTFDQTVTVRF